MNMWSTAPLILTSTRDVVECVLWATSVPLHRGKGLIFSTFIVGAFCCKGWMLLLGFSSKITLLSSQLKIWYGGWNFILYYPLQFIRIACCSNMICWCWLTSWGLWMTPCLLASCYGGELVLILIMLDTLLSSRYNIL